MRSRFPNDPDRACCRARTVALVTVLVLGVTACADDSTSAQSGTAPSGLPGDPARDDAHDDAHDHAHDHGHDDDGASGDHAHAAVAGRPDRVVAGPQGRVPQFVIECGFSHHGVDDPIVHPGRSGEGHLHTFFGNRTTTADSTVESLLAGDSTCDPVTDRAAYWAPALSRGGVVIDPVRLTAYYRAGPDVDPTVVEPYPLGLAMIAGDASATSPQPVEVVAWRCGVGADHRAAPPSCPPARSLHLVVTFPDCWDGTRLDSENHVAHVAYSTGGECPPSHPVHIPQLQTSIEYPVHGDPTGLELASGPVETAHADFWNAWEPDALRDEVTLCLHRDVVCGVTRS